MSTKEDRSNPPLHYKIRLGYNFTIPSGWLWGAGDWLPMNGGPGLTRDQAIAACWAHRDAVVLDARNDAKEPSRSPTVNNDGAFIGEQVTVTGPANFSTRIEMPSGLGGSQANVTGSHHLRRQIIVMGGNVEGEPTKEGE